MNKLKSLRLEKNISMAKVAQDLGMAYTTYVNYEKASREPNSETLKLLANYFSCSIDYLLGRSEERNLESESISAINIIPLPKTVSIPLLGTIACGTPVLATENIDRMIFMPDGISADFALLCKGDSMINARIFDGDVVYIKEQPDVDDGTIAAVLIGEEATLKRVYHYPNRIVLRACNPVYDDMVITDAELDTVRILGKAVAFLSAVR